MTRKDFILIAQALHDEKPNESWLNKMVQWKLDVKSMADTFACSFPRFNHSLFVYACESGDVNARRVK